MCLYLCLAYLMIYQLNNFCLFSELLRLISVYNTHILCILNTQNMIKKALFFLIAVALAISPVLSQVGINTEDPQASLDVNGDLKVRTVVVDNTSSSVLVLDGNNVVHQNTALLGLSTKSFVEATGATAITLLDLVLLSGWNKIPFSTEEFDEHNDYNNTTTYEFTAPQAGIYNIYVQLETTGVVTAGEVGVAIFKKAFGASTYTMLAQESYLNVSINVLGIGVGVSPPTRNVQRLVKLAKGDVITFGAKVPLLSVTLVGGSKSFFTIEHVK